MMQIQWPIDWIVGNAIAENGKATVKLSFNGELDERGKKLEKDINDALAQPRKDQKIRELGRLVQCFSVVVLCHPKVAELLDNLWEKGERQAVSRIVGDAYQGRPHNNNAYFLQIAMVESLLAEGYKSVRKAAEVVYEKLLKLGYSITAASIQNNYSRYKPMYDVWHNGYRVNSRNYLSKPWSPPASSN